MKKRDYNRECEVSSLWMRDRDLETAGALIHRGQGVWAELFYPMESREIAEQGRGIRSLDRAAGTLRAMIREHSLEDRALLTFGPAKRQSESYSPSPRGILELLDTMDREGPDTVAKWVCELVESVAYSGSIDDELSEAVGGVRMNRMEVLRQRTGPDRPPIGEWTEERWTTSSRAFYVQSLSVKTVRAALEKKPLPKLRAALYRTGELRMEANDLGIRPTKNFVCGRLLGEGVAGTFETAEKIQIVSEALDEAPTILRKASVYLAERAAQKLTASEISAGIGVSEARLRRIVREHTGLDFMDWNMRERITMARDELVGSKDTISKIRERYGIPNHRSFRLNFVKYTGMLPKDYRRKYGPAINPDVEEALKWAQGNLSRDITGEDIAERAGYSYDTLRIEVKKHTGKTITEWLTSERVALATKIFDDSAKEQQNIEVREVAERCGLPARSTFQNQFRKHTGMSPSEYRKYSASL